ncbi:MAG: hypothetical protein EDM03_14555 [Porphyrobacter sp. IPPAS B-1204]|nr:MAG: hypothetical protein EDM03_14555 [Porphyrobacter sp. IPPAS B-1204]
MAIRFAALTAALALASMAAPAAAQSYKADQVKKSVNQADLLAIVGSLGHQVREQGAQGEVFVVAQDGEGLNYFLIGTACDANGVPGCQGIMMQVRYDLTGGTTLEALAKANLGQAALNIWADFSEQTLGFTRYQVLDHGVTMANIRENVVVMLDLVAESYPIAAGEE